SVDEENPHCWSCHRATVAGTCWLVKLNQDAAPSGWIKERAPVGAGASRERVTRVELATLCLASTRSSQLSYTRLRRRNCSTARGSVNHLPVLSPTRRAIPAPLACQARARCTPLEYLPKRQLFSHQGFDPGVGASQPLLQRYLRLPAQHLPETGIIGVAPPHPLRTFDGLFGDAEAGNLGDHIRQLVDGDQAILAQIEGLVIVRLHQFAEAGHTVVDITKRAGLRSVAPDCHLGVA